jgi:predicted kinase
MTNPPCFGACLVVLVGPPGAGKTTWARRQGRGAVHVSQDDLIDAITPDGFEHAYCPVYRQAEDAVARAALAAGHTVIVDRTNRTRAHREHWLRIAAEVACPAIAVVMATPEALCRQRNAERVGTSRVSDERIERMFAALEPVRPDEGFVVIHDGESISLGEILSGDFRKKEPVSHEHCH